MPLVQVGLLSLLAINVLPLPGALGALRAQEQIGGSSFAYLYELNVTSNSDWTNLIFAGGPTVLGFNASVVQGAQAPNLTYVAQPTLISINKKSFDTTTVEIQMQILAMAGALSGNVSIAKGNLGSTNATLALYKSGTFQPFLQLVNSGVTGGLNARNFTIDYSTLYDNPSDSAELQGIPSSLDHTVLAFYYPWYGNPAGPSGQWSHWEGVTQDFILSATDYPLLGAYDSQDPAVIGAQISLARQAGIEGFISSWWGIGDFTDRSFSVLLQVARRMNFTVTIYYETVRNLTSSGMVNELSYVVRQYGSNPAFLKANGVPVIFVYAVGAYSRNATYWLDVRKGLESNVGQVYLVGDVTDESYINVFDGFHDYIQLNCSQMTEDYDFLAKSMSAGLLNVSWNSALNYVEHGTPLPVEKKALFFTVIPGNDRLGANRTGGGPILLVDRQAGKTYAKFWAAAISLNATGVLITSWNEWHEGTEIEPSLQYGFTYINLTRQYTSLYTGTVQPTSSTSLTVQTDLPNVFHQGQRNASVTVTDDSPNVQTVYVNLTISSSEGLNLTQADHDGTYCYTEDLQPNRYSAVIPLIEPGETIPFNITLVASVGARHLNVTATGYSPSAEVNVAYANNQFQVVQNITLSRYATEYIVIGAAAVAILLAVLVLLIRKRSRWKKRRTQRVPEQ
jgi:hypothetical protein